MMDSRWRVPVSIREPMQVAVEQPKGSVRRMVIMGQITCPSDGATFQHVITVPPGRVWQVLSCYNFIAKGGAAVSQLGMRALSNRDSATNKELYFVVTPVLAAGSYSATFGPTMSTTGIIAGGTYNNLQVAIPDVPLYGGDLIVVQFYNNNTGDTLSTNITVIEGDM